MSDAERPFRERDSDKSCHRRASLFAPRFWRAQYARMENHARRQNDAPAAASGNWASDGLAISEKFDIKALGTGFGMYP
jgi:hypothetical protein